MPYKIVRNDITKMIVDAIVNSTSIDAMQIGDTELSIFDAAGPELTNARKELGDMRVS